MLDSLPAWTAHAEYQESLSGPLLVKHCIEVCCCFRLVSSNRLTRSFHREWLLLLRGRLAQSGVDLPELFAEGPEGDEELMRFALCYNILQVRCRVVVCVKLRHVWAAVC
jgi:hypothetical protein